MTDPKPTDPKPLEYAGKEKPETIGEDLVSWEIVNLAQEAGECPPPALAWISINGAVYETDVDVLDKLATEAKAARKRSKNGLGGRGGSAIAPKELAKAARQRTLEWKAPELIKERPPIGPRRRTVGEKG